MFIAYCVLAVIYAVMLTFSGVTKLQHNPQAVQIIHETVGVPLGFFPVLAALELAAALGLVAGIRWPGLGIAAAAGAVIYFVGAVTGHLRVGDVAGIGGAVFMLVVASALLLLRAKTRRRTR
jgi:sorbitol-specific phosphotransferase system component IIC